MDVGVLVSYFGMEKFWDELVFCVERVLVVLGNGCVLLFWLLVRCGVVM